MTDLPETRLWLIRHAAPAISADRCYGRTDPKLSRSGRRQAQQIAARLSKEPLVAIYSSAQRRAIQTADAIACVHALTVQCVEEFAEIDFGDLDGLTYTEIQSQFPDVFQAWMTTPTAVRFPGGEAFTDLYDRVTRTAQILLDRHRGSSFAIVSHSGVIRSLLAQAFCLPPANVFRIGQRYSAMNLISFIGDFPIVELLNG